MTSIPRSVLITAFLIVAIVMSSIVDQTQALAPAFVRRVVRRIINNGNGRNRENSVPPEQVATKMAATRQAATLNNDDNDRRLLRWGWQRIAGVIVGRLFRRRFVPARN